MKHQLNNKILIIGPKPSRKGGVATHVGNLKKYKVFKDAEVFEVGSRGKQRVNPQNSFIEIIRSLRILREKASTEEYIILINATLYSTAFFKLILILFSLVKIKIKNIYVFYHGGRLKNYTFLPRYLADIFSFLLEKVDRFYFLSTVQKEIFKKNIGDYPSGIYNNFSASESILERDEMYKSDEINLLFVGRVVKEKGLYDLIDAAATIYKHGFSNFHLNIVGEGKALLDLQKKVKNRNLENKISFYGYLENKDLENIYKKNDWFILPSYEEAFPYVFIESMRAGVPIIATRTGALERTVEEGKNGYLIDAHNADDLYEKLKFIIENRPCLKDNCYYYFKKNLSKKRGEQFYTKLLDPD